LLLGCFIFLKLVVLLFRFLDIHFLWLVLKNWFLWARTASNWLVVFFLLIALNFFNLVHNFILFFLFEVFLNFGFLCCHLFFLLELEFFFFLGVGVVENWVLANLMETLPLNKLLEHVDVHFEVVQNSKASLFKHFFVFILFSLSLLLFIVKAIVGD